MGLSALPQEHVLRTLLVEHDAIWRLVDRLGALGESLSANRGGFEEHLVDLLSLIHYLNRTEVHERREDRGVFAALEALGHDTDTRSVRATHARATVLREQLRRLAAPAAEELPWVPDLGRVCKLIGELAALTRAHLEHEEQVVFPLALRALPDATWAQLAREHPAADPCPFRLRVAR